MGIEWESMKKSSQGGYQMSLWAHLLLYEPISRRSLKSSICDFLILTSIASKRLFNLPPNLPNDIEYKIANFKRIDKNY